jgi:hypothetical protein
MVVAVLGVPVLLFTAAPAEAFTLDGDCTGSARLHGERDANFVADDGVTHLGYGIWQWNFTSTGKINYELWVKDERPPDGASMVTEVVTAAGGVIRYENRSQYVISYGVKKYRFVWNGYPSSYFDPASCNWATS